jgi:hypothetical protein
MPQIQSNWLKFNQIGSNSVKCLKFSQIDSNSIKLTQIQSNWLKFSQMPQIQSNWLKFNQIDSNSIKLTQIQSNWLKFSQIDSNSVKLTQVQSNWLNHQTQPDHVIKLYTLMKKKILLKNIKSYYWFIWLLKGGHLILLTGILPMSHFAYIFSVGKMTHFSEFCVIWPTGILPTEIG